MGKFHSVPTGILLVYPAWRKETAGDPLVQLRQRSVQAQCGRCRQDVPGAEGMRQRDVVGLCVTQSLNCGREFWNSLLPGLGDQVDTNI